MPVTTRPSGSTMAPAGPPVVSSFSSAAERAGDRFWLMPAWFIRSSIFFRASSPVPVRLISSAVWKSTRKVRIMASVISSPAMVAMVYPVTRQASSSEMATPAMFTPMSVGDW